MDLPSIYIYVFIMGLLIFLIFERRKRSNLPPGPLGVPLLGFLPFMGSNPAETLMKLKKKYGSVISIQIGSDVCVVLNDFESVNEAFVKQSGKFSDRPENAYIKYVTNCSGLIFSNETERWKTLRKFGQATLREFGFHNSLEENISEECSLLVDHIACQNDLSLREKVFMATTNVMSRIVVGRHFSYDDETFMSLIQSMWKFFSDSTSSKIIGLVIMCPILLYFPPFWSTIREDVADHRIHMDIFHKIVENHRSTYDESHTRDLVDAFLKRMEKGQNNQIFTENNLVYFINDLFNAGSSTTTSTLLWSIFALAHFPQCQNELAQEIVDTIGESGSPTVHIQDKMPYTSAFIHEIMRLKPVVPIGLSHQASESCELLGFHVSKGTTVIANIWAVHHDPALFPEPEVFKPERFIDQKGNFVRSRHVIPFSVGPRYCLGDRLAQMEIFIFLTTIVQKYQIVPNSTLPSFHDGGFNGLTYESPNYKVNFKKR